VRLRSHDIFFGLSRQREEAVPHFEINLTK
jgi:hypothetical protein